MSEISDKILRLIQERGYSYGALAELTGIPKSALQRYATGETGKIPLERVETLARALGVSPAYLMGLEEQTAAEEEMQELLFQLRTRPDMRMLFKLAKDASPKDVKRAVAIIEALRSQE